MAVKVNNQHRWFDGQSCKNGIVTLPGGHFVNRVQSRHTGGRRVCNWTQTWLTALVLPSLVVRRERERERGPFEGGVAAEYQSVMSIGPNKVMNGNCEPPSGRTSIRSSRPVVQFPPLYPILSALAPFYIRHEPSPLIDFKSFNRIPAQGLDNHSRRGSPM